MCATHPYCDPACASLNYFRLNRCIHSGCVCVSLCLCVCVTVSLSTMGTKPAGHLTSSYKLKGQGQLGALQGDHDQTDSWWGALIAHLAEHAPPVPRLRPGINSNL